MEVTIFGISQGTALPFLYGRCRPLLTVVHMISLTITYISCAAIVFNRVRYARQAGSRKAR